MLPVKMSPFVASFVAMVMLGLEARGKTVTGLFRSKAARQKNGQFITRFTYRGDGGLLVCRLETTALVQLKEARLLLFQDPDPNLDHLGCSERLARAQFTIWLSEQEHNQSIPHQATPTVWSALYADKYTCQDDELVSSHDDISFTVLLMNVDSAGNPLDHFSADEAGLQSFYFMLLLSYFLAGCIYLQPLWHALRKGGPMHPVLKVLTSALFLQGGSALCNYAHLSRFSSDGLGIPRMGSLAEFWDMLSQVSMLYLLLSLGLGWTLSRGKKAPSRPLGWERSPASSAAAAGGVLTQVGLLLWEQWSEAGLEHHSGPALLGVAGRLLLGLRVALALLLASLLYQIISSERSALKRDFYLCFAKGCFLWFLCHPVLFLMSVIFNPHQREKVVTMGVVLCQSISMVILYQLFLSRSLYWEVSSLSSASLPLIMSRTPPRGRY
ncbi:integral membrane protein GPR180 isoform X2 [Antennarius striatus]|uniref:integral membrane protein GPR180 isoform X2 n=1 Tax=Antennarius striatus TaxID=241820 RepID=UPI0035ADDC8B